MQHTSTFAHHCFSILQKFKISIFVFMPILIGWGAFQARNITLDTSFRPLFADDPSIKKQTDIFEEKFGQISSAYIGVIFETDSIFNLHFLNDLEQLQQHISSIDHIVEILSPIQLTMPPWVGENPMIGIKNQTNAISLQQAALSNPFLVKKFISQDARDALLLIRTDIPIHDLDARRLLIEKFKKTVQQYHPKNATMHFIGVSLVEATYADIVLKGLFKSTGLITAMLMLMSFIIFGQLSSVLVVLAGVSAALPITLGIMQRFGYQMTMVNSLVPSMLLIIGVADAIHLHTAYQHALQKGFSKTDAARDMFQEMAFACFMTACTTALGFLSLLTADLSAIREFGICTSIAVFVVYLCNTLLVPHLLQILPIQEKPANNFIVRAVEHTTTFISDYTVRSPYKIIVLFTIITVLSFLSLNYLDINQKFNAEVHTKHPLRQAQTLLEQKFNGFLGPDISIERTDKKTILTAQDLQQLNVFKNKLKQIKDVDDVLSIFDVAPENSDPEAVIALANMARLDPQSSHYMQQRIDASDTTLAMMVKIPDVGTQRAQTLVQEIERTAQNTLGSHYEVHIVGQWWLAQKGMMSLVSDMVGSFTAALLSVLPIMAVLLRSWRLLLISILPNILPNLFALAFMSITGITLRIGTAMMMAIALGIAVDDTVHFMSRLKTEDENQQSPVQSVRQALLHTGKPIAFTSIILTLGFLAMSVSDLIALQDMGIVGAGCMIVGFFGDMFLAPALYLMSYDIKNKFLQKK